MDCPSDTCTAGVFWGVEPDHHPDGDGDCRLYPIPTQVAYGPCPWAGHRHAHAPTA